MKQRTIRKFFSNISYRNLLFTLIGSAIVAFGTTIHVDSGAADGGVIGVARIIEYYTNGKVGIELSTLIINIFCYILAWRLTNSKFVLNMAVGTLSFSLFLSIFNNTINLEIPYVFLATLIGMLCIEIGTGLMLRYGSSPNGEHVLSMAIVKRGEFDFGWVHFIKDFVIIIMFFPITDPSSVIYSLILMTITTPIVDFIVTAPKKETIKENAAKNKESWIPILITGLVLIILFSLASGYINDFYKADTAAINAVKYETVDISEFDGGFTAYVPKDEIKAGFVFYPGGKVEYTAYAPLLEACADQGILCIAVEMPINLAFFGINKAIGAMELYPEVENWYIGGHSLGGTMAANCASSHQGLFEGVVLLASYSISDLTSLHTLSIYGSDDKVLNFQKYDKYEDNLPKDFVEYVIKGGNHAYFGMYGEQKGDGKASITNIEQIILTADYIAKFILE